MSPRRRDPDVSGVLVVDKPAGMTSHDVVATARRALGLRKVGHTGTLDPDATGVLVLAVGRATRLVSHLQAGRKTYAARMVLGRETTTQDAAGEVVEETDASHVTERVACDALKAFVGEITQIPPMVSAVKVGGERLHEKARRGETVERDARHVTIHDLVLEDFVPGSKPEVAFLVTCSAGTYIRTLAHDVGQRLEVGGSLLSLRRLANGPFTVDEALTLDEVVALGDDHRLRERLLAPADALRGLSRLEVPLDVARGLAHGKSLAAAGYDGPYAVTTEGNVLVGVYRDQDGRGRPEVVLIRPDDDLERASADAAAASSASGGDDRSRA